MKLPLLVTGLALLLPLSWAGADPASPEVTAAMAKGIAYLSQQQQPDGSFANPANPTASTEHPALTALPALALAHDPAGASAHKDALNKAWAYLRSKAQPDGGIYGKGLSNYNTSIVLLALLASDDPQNEPFITRAHAFIAGQQAKGLAQDEMNGGFGYGPVGTSPNHPHPDLDNTLVALQALDAYRKARPNAENIPSLDFKAAIDFISRCQQLPETNQQPWVDGSPANKGGFVYFPGTSRAGEITLPDGRKALRSYGSMTYAGLLSFIYADLPKDDQRVKAALDWLSRNYTVEENPGLGHQGLFYYYQLAVRGLTAAQVKELTLADGRRIDWRADLTHKIVSLQSADGSWLNDASRWMENDPVLVTSYCVLALENLTGGK